MLCPIVLFRPSRYPLRSPAVCTENLNTGVVQQFEANGQHHKQIHGGKLRRMVMQEGSPFLARWPASFYPYLATLDCATSTPSLSSSPWMRGAPHSGFSTLIRRINSRSSGSIRGCPPRRCDFQRQ